MSANMYLKLDKIKGESTDDKHKDEIGIMGFSHGLSQPTSCASLVGGNAAAASNFESFTVSKFVDAASPDLHLFCARGDPIDTAVVEICQATGEPVCYWRYDFKNLIVQSISVTGGGSERPMEHVSFVYTECKWTYTPVDNKGQKGTAVDRCWSLAEHKKV
jgi:type VI secretion system secreted protein Hcp